MSEYNQRPCPNCQHQETHMPVEHTKAMVCQCSECRYEFVKHPEEIDRPELDATPNDALRELIEEWRSSAEYLHKHADEYASPKQSAGASGALEDAADELEEKLR